VKLFDTLDAAVRALLDGRVDIASVDAASVQYAIQRNPQWDIHQVSFNEPYDPNFPIITSRWNVVYGLRKEAPNLAKAFNDKIAEIWAKYLNHQIAQKYGLGDDW
jgi:polar amino acid transport system substrate-binding protein